MVNAPFPFLFHSLKIAVAIYKYWTNNTAIQVQRKRQYKPEVLQET